MNLCLWLNQHNASSSNISRNLFRSSVFMKIFLQLAVHLPINWAKCIKLLAKRKPRIEIREMAKKAHVWTDEGFDENSRGSTNWIRKQLLPDVYIHAYGVYAIAEKSRAFQRVSAPTQLRAAMVEFSPAQTVPGPWSSPCHCVCIIMLITTYGSNNASTSI